jgi:hypothetical protein
MTGSQIPRIRVEPERDLSDGAAAAALMEAYGVPLAEWQRMVLDCWLGKSLSGSPTTTNAGLSAPRQNGKNVCLEAREFFGLVIRGEKILHTAHQVVTGKKSFRRLERMFTDRRHPEIQKLVKYIRYTNGEETIELENGGSIEFSARSRQRARGFAGISLVVFDEAQELTDDQMDAIMPTLSASATGTRQILYTGTPPYPGCPGEVFRRRRRVCMTDPSPHDAWHEWSVAAESIQDIKVDDTGLWYTVNPALGINLSEDFTRNELKTLTADGFARERLGWWSPVLAQKEDLAIPTSAWDACKSGEEKPEGKTAYGVKFSYDGSGVTLCGAVIPKEGPARVSLIESRPTGRGTQWLADWLIARHGRASCVVIDGRNGADVLVDKIAGVWREKNAIIRPSAKHVIAAASLLCDCVNEQTVTWYFGQELLRQSAVTATKRPVGGGWAFGGEFSPPIEAAALALWGAKTSKRDPTRKMRIG